MEVGLALENQGGVGGILHDDEVVGLGEGDGFFEKLERRGGTGRVVRVVEHHDLGAWPRLGRDGVEVWQEVVLSLERHVVDLAAEYTWRACRGPGSRVRS